MQPPRRPSLRDGSKRLCRSFRSRVLYVSIGAERRRIDTSQYLICITCSASYMPSADTWWSQTLTELQPTRWSQPTAHSVIGSSSDPHVTPCIYILITHVCLRVHSSGGVLSGGRWWFSLFAGARHAHSVALGRSTDPSVVERTLRRRRTQTHRTRNTTAPDDRTLALTPSQIHETTAHGSRAYM